MPQMGDLASALFLPLAESGFASPCISSSGWFLCPCVADRRNSLFRCINDCLGNRKHASLRQFEHHLIKITPAPVFTRLKGAYNGVAGGVEMRGGVLIL